MHLRVPFLILLLSSFPAPFLHAETNTAKHQPYFPLKMPGWNEQAFVTSGKAGIDPFFDYAGIYQGNGTGGASYGTAYTHEIVAGAEINLEHYLGFTGTSLIISGINATGRNLSEDLGNLFTVSQAYTPQTLLLSNFALRVELFDRKLELRLGRMGPGQFFARLPASSLQISGGINGNPNSLYTNIPFTTAGGPTWSAYAKAFPTETTFASAGVFQASPRSGDNRYHGVDFRIRPGDGILVLAEGGWFPTFGKTEEVSGKNVDTPVTANPGLPGIYKLGAYYSDYTFTDFLGGEESKAYGFYAMGQQMLWRDETRHDHHFSLWGGFTYTPQETIALTPVMGFFGTIWQGLIPTRDKDQILFTVLTGGFGENYARSQRQAGSGSPSAETVLDWSYVLQLTEQIAIQPDLQWIIRPGGTGNIPNALVLGIQVSAHF